MTKRYLGYSDRAKAYADLDARFASYSTKGEGFVADGVALERDKLNTLVNTTMQAGGGQLDIVGTPRVESAIAFPANVTVNFVDGAALAVDPGVTVTFNGPIRSNNSFAATFPNSTIKVVGGKGHIVMPGTGVISVFRDQTWVGPYWTQVAVSTSPSDSSLRDDILGMGWYMPVGGGLCWAAIVGGVEIFRFTASGVAGQAGIVSIGTGDEYRGQALDGDLVFHYNRGVSRDNAARNRNYSLLRGGDYGNIPDALIIGGGYAQGGDGPGPIAFGIPAAAGLTGAGIDEPVLRNGKRLLSTTAAGTGTAPLIGSDANDLTSIPSTPISIANNGVAIICTTAKVGMLFVWDTAAGFQAPAQFALLGTGAVVRKLQDSENVYSIAKDTAAKTNLYAEAGSYKIQNKVGGANVYHLVFIGS